MMGWICRKIYTWWGWKLTGVIPNHIKKKIYITIPHTSNWDFPIGILLKFGYGMDVQYLIKNAFMKPPIGWIFKKLGGIGVDRSKANNFVDRTVAVINEHDKISISIAPEGTRKKVDKLKSGFYWIALKTEVPLIFVQFDWQNKIVNFAEPYYVSGDYDKDLIDIRNHFDGVVGHTPKNGWLYLKDQS